MQFTYFDMLTGNPLYLKGVGHIKSPTLREISPGTGIGYDYYTIYISFFFWEKEDVLSYNAFCGVKNVERLKNPKLSTFDVITLLPYTREFCREVLSFFITDDIKWDNTTHKFLLYDKDDAEQIIGEISRKNYGQVKDAILELNYIGLSKDQVPTKFESKKAEELWERAQSMKKQQEKEHKKDIDKEGFYNIGNIVSKLCAVSEGSYNYFNVFGLTIFQLYDAFFQYSYLKGIKLGEDIFTRVGGDKFNFNDWLKPLHKIQRRQ